MFSFDIDLKVNEPFELSAQLAAFRETLTGWIADLKRELQSFRQYGSFLPAERRQEKQTSLHCGTCYVLQCLQYHLLPDLRAEHLAAISKAAVTADVAESDVFRRCHWLQTDDAVARYALDVPAVVAARKYLDELCRWEGITRLASKVDSCWEQWRLSMQNGGKQ